VKALLMKTKHRQMQQHIFRVDVAEAGSGGCSGSGGGSDLGAVEATGLSAVLSELPGW